MIVDRFLNSGTLMLLAVTHASRISTIIADALVVALTWVKTFQSVRMAVKLKLDINMAWLLLRDGACPYAGLYATVLML